MTDTGMTIALIVSSFIAQLVASLVAVFVGRPRKSQANPAPERSEPKNRLHKTDGWFIRVLKSPWMVPCFFILLDLYSLQKTLRETGPLTRWAVLVISSDVGGILYWLLVIAIGITWRTLDRVVDIEREIVDIFREFEEVHKLLHDWMHLFTGKVSSQSKSVDHKFDKAVRETQHKLRLAMRKLFED